MIIDPHPDSPHPYNSAAVTLPSTLSQCEHAYSHGRPFSTISHHHHPSSPLSFHRKSHPIRLLTRPGPDATSYFPDVEVLRDEQRKEDHGKKLTYSHRHRTHLPGVRHQQSKDRHDDNFTLIRMFDRGARVQSYDEEFQHRGRPLFRQSNIKSAVKPFILPPPAMFGRPDFTEEHQEVEEQKYVTRGLFQPRQFPMSHSRNVSDVSHFSDDDDDGDESDASFSSKSVEKANKDSSKHLMDDEGCSFYAVPLSSPESTVSNISSRHRRNASIVDGKLFCREDENGFEDHLLSTRQSDNVMQRISVATFESRKCAGERDMQHAPSHQRRNRSNTRASPPSQIHAGFVQTPYDRPTHARPPVPIEFQPQTHRMAHLSLNIPSHQYDRRRSVLQIQQQPQQYQTGHHHHHHHHRLAVRRHSSHDLDREHSLEDNM